jgi:phage virion morphogenesis protein
MSDELIKISNNLPEVRKKLQELARRCGSTRPALKGMGQYLELSSRGRFDKETDPQGKKWKPIKAATIARKAKKGKPTAILHEDLNLRDRITSDVQGETLLVGSPEKYAAAQQLGAEIKQEGMTLHFKGRKFTKKGDHDRTKTVNRTIKIDAREFLGVSTADEAELLLIAGDYLMA